MSNSEKRRVTIEAPSPAVEIYVLDHALQRVPDVPDAWGRLEVDLAPGLYLVKFKIGPSAAQETLVVQPGKEPMVHTAGRLPIPCVAPVVSPAGTADEVRARHIRAVDRVSRAVHRKLGEGAQLMVFGRDATGAAWPTGGSELSLRLPSGEELVRADVGDRDGAEGWFGANVEIAPGGYLLALETPAGHTVQMPLWVAAGLQTQVFLRRDNFLQAGGQNDELPDLANATVHIRQIGAGFGGPGSASEWVAETLFLAYGDGRNGASDAGAAARTLQRLGLEMAVGLVEAAVVAGSAFLGGSEDGPLDDDAPGHGEKARAAIAEALRRLENPMVALLIGRMFARTQQEGASMTDEFLDYVRDRLPDHPDGLALRIGRDEVPPFAFPPMFAEGLADVEKARLVVSGSLAAEAVREATAHDIWVRWSPVAPSESTTRGGPMDEDEALQTLWSATRESPERLMRAAPALRPIHKQMVQNLSSLAHMAQLDGHEPSMDDVRASIRAASMTDEVRQSVLSDLAEAVE